jgi:MFS-type transporter involved in bile tolerance (Atg22 family)
VGSILLLMVAIGVVPLSVSAISAIVFLKRRARNAPARVPAVVAVAALAFAIWDLVPFVSAVASIQPGSPVSKATLMSLGISHALNCTALFLLAGTPLLVFAFLLDRRMGKGSRQAQG